MHMLGVMSRLGNESGVRFLLSAYAETLQRHDHGRGLPRSVTVSPVAGVGDIRARYETLLDIELNGGTALTGARPQAMVLEAAQVFGVALARLQSLQAASAVVILL